MKTTLQWWDSSTRFTSTWPRVLWDALPLPQPQVSASSWGCTPPPNLQRCSRKSRKLIASIPRHVIGSSCAWKSTGNAWSNWFSFLLITNLATVVGIRCIKKFVNDLGLQMSLKKLLTCWLWLIFLLLSFSSPLLDTKYLRYDYFIITWDKIYLLISNTPLLINIFSKDANGWQRTLNKVWHVYTYYFMGSVSLLL